MFAETQRIVRWHYQWMVIHEFLPKTIGDLDDQDRSSPRVASSTTGATTPTFPSSSPSPHTGSGTRKIRPSYARTSGRRPTQQFFALVFKPVTRTPPTQTTFAAAAGRHAASSTGRPSSTSATGGSANKMIDTSVSSILFHLMGQSTGTLDSLAIRNLVRNLTMEVPSGQSVAEAMKAAGSGDERSGRSRRTTSTGGPRWFYVLREAEVKAGGVTSVRWAGGSSAR